MGILINGSVPDLVGSRVECEYGPGVSTAATLHLDYGPAQIQTCPLLPREHYQPILPGTGETEHRHPFDCVPAVSIHTIQVRLQYVISVFFFPRRSAALEQM